MWQDEEFVDGAAEYMGVWVKRDYTKGEIDRAGTDLVPWWTDGTEPSSDTGDCYIIIDNWRTSHAMPLLTFRMGLANRAKRVEPQAIIAQRLKRFSSVMNKLAREPNMKLSQMHDLGGCRAIVSSIEVVRCLYDLYRENQGLFQSEGAIKCYDYISEPKTDGYRGIHVVGRYRARLETNEPWNGHRVEIQLRTQLQHAFATAVETVTTFIREPLKFGSGPVEWRRFFSLVGSAFAIREGTALVEGTPSDRNELVRELRELTKALKVFARLRGWTNALKQLPVQAPKRANWLLLVLDVSANTTTVTGYEDRKKASEQLANIEQQRLSGLDAVLVWVGSIRDLRRAYPNYYADTKAFLAALRLSLRR